MLKTYVFMSRLNPSESHWMKVKNIFGNCTKYYFDTFYDQFNIIYTFCCFCQFDRNKMLIYFQL